MIYNYKTHYCPCCFCLYKYNGYRYYPFPLYNRFSAAEIRFFNTTALLYLSKIYARTLISILSPPSAQGKSGKRLVPIQSTFQSCIICCAETKSPSESEFKYIINPIKPSRFWICGDPPPQWSAQGCERATRKRETGTWRRDGGRHAGRNAADGMVIVSLKDV